MRRAGSERPRIRWPWIVAVALGWLMGLTFAAWAGVTGARLGPPDAFDLGAPDSPPVRQAGASRAGEFDGASIRRSSATRVP
jgi:hypothetical protein